MDCPKDLPVGSVTTHPASAATALQTHAGQCGDVSPPQASRETIAVEISADELAFAILIESHHAAFPPLYDVAVTAVRSSHPDDWKDKICSCFDRCMKQHVKEGLENTTLPTDIFVACKIIRYRLNDVAAYVGGAFSDPRDKERLSLQVQGLEASRNWAFHDEFVSLREVQSTLRLLLSVLASLGCGQELNRLLEQYLQQIDDAFRTAENIQQHTMHWPVFAKTMVYRSLGEFEKEFSSFFKLQHSTKQSSPQTKRDDTSAEGFQRLTKQIRQELTKPKKERKFCIDIKKARQQCSNIEKVRKKFAHYLPLTNEEVFGVITEICELLQSFQLCSERAQSAVNAVADKDGRPVDCLLSKQAMFESGACHKRILRPKGGHFVGRKAETIAITQVLTTRSEGQSQQHGQVVVIFGAAGVGKSYLANKLVRDLRETYPQQNWFCCSADSRTTCSHEISSAVRNVSCPSSDMAQPSQLNGIPWLVVLDDVCLSAAQQITQILSESHCSSFLLTTRNTSVKNLLQQKMACLKVVNLHPFSNAETSDFLQRTLGGKVTPEQLIKAYETAIWDLGNLPLCVNIFASLVAVGRRKKLHDEFYKSIDDFSKWTTIEDQFGDSFHVRGLKGVLEVAKKNIEDRPLILFFLAKTVCCESECIPWDVMTTKPSWDSSGIHRYFAFDEDVLKDMFRDLSTVVDWLFSPQAEQILECCRSTLEELGLIIWDEQTSTCHLHTLILKGARTMLSENHLFLSSFLHHVSKVPREHVKVQLAAERLSCALHNYLLCQVVLTGVNIVHFSCFPLKNGESAAVWLVPERRLFAALLFDFLTAALKCKTLVGAGHRCRSHLPGSIVLLVVRSLVADCLLKLPCDALSFGHSKATTEQLDWISFYYEMPLNLEQLLLYEKRMEQWKTWDGSIVSLDKHSTMVFLEYFMGEIDFIRALEGHDSIDEALVHCAIAELLFYTGTLTLCERDIYWYMAEASKVCSSLAIPTKSDLQNHLREIEQEVKLECYPNFKRFQTVSVWSKLCFFRVESSLESREQVDDDTKEYANLMAAVLQESQKFYIRSLQRMLALSGRTDHYVLLMMTSSATEEMLIWLKMNTPGKSLCSAIRCFHDLFDVYEGRNPLGAGEHSNIASKEHFKDLSRHGNVTLTKAMMDFAALIVGYQVSTLEFENRSPSSAGECEKPEQETATGQSKRLQPSIIHPLHSDSIECHYFRAISTLECTFDIHRSLTYLLACLKSQAMLQPERVGESRPSSGQENNILALVPRLCTLLGPAVSCQVIDDLSGIKHNTRSSLWRDSVNQIITNIKQLSAKHPEAEATYKHFRQAQNALQQNNHRLACTAALQCWRGVVLLNGSGFFFALELPDQRARDWFPQELILCFFLALADLLRQIYAAQKKYDIAKWFVLFLLKRVDQTRVFQVAQFQSMYIDILTQNEEHSAALEKCHILQHFMTEQFGEDYLEWLPNAPNPVEMRASLENNITPAV